MEKNKKKYYYNNGNKYYLKKKKKREKEMNEEKITYEKLVNVESNDEIIDYPRETNDNMMKFVFLAVVVMAIIFGSLLLFHLI